MGTINTGKRHIKGKWNIKGGIKGVRIKKKTIGDKILLEEIICCKIFWYTWSRNQRSIYIQLFLIVVIPRYLWVIIIVTRNKGIFRKQGYNKFNMEIINMRWWKRWDTYTIRPPKRLLYVSKENWTNTCSTFSSETIIIQN